MALSFAFPAFLGPIGPWEFALIAGIGLLLFGKNLPDVGRQIGKALVEFRRGLNQLKHQVTSDPALREARGALDDLRREVQAPSGLVRNMRDPIRMLENLTQPDLATPGPRVTPVDPPPKSFLDIDAAPPQKPAS